MGKYSQIISFNLTYFNLAMNLTSWLDAEKN